MCLPSVGFKPEDKERIIQERARREMLNQLSELDRAIQTLETVLGKDWIKIILSGPWIKTRHIAHKAERLIVASRAK